MGGCSWCRVGLGNPYSTRCVTALPHLRIVLSRPASSHQFGCGGLNVFYLDDEAGVRFTLYELKKELRSRGHDINLQSLIESLNICNRVVLTVCQADGKVMLQSAIFPVLLLGSKQEWRKNPKETYCYVQFHPFISRCINRLTYLQLKYVA